MKTYNSTAGLQLDDLLVGSAPEIADALDRLDPATEERLLTAFIAFARRAMGQQEGTAEPVVHHALAVCQHLQRSHVRELRLTFMLDAAAYLHSINKSAKALAVANLVLFSAERSCERQLARRAHNCIGGISAHVALYEDTARHLEAAFQLARDLDDERGLVSGMVNASLMFLQLGLHRDAASIGKGIVDRCDDSVVGMRSRLKLSLNGLHSAHRAGMHAEALKFLDTGTAVLHAQSWDPADRAVFEYNRAHYLIDTDDAETARELVEAARAEMLPSTNMRVQIALDLSMALCWIASREPAEVKEGRELLRALYYTSKTHNVQHDDVLWALMRAFGGVGSPEDAVVGMGYASELVDYTTRVKRAKFFHQLDLRGVRFDQSGVSVEARGPDDPLVKLRSLVLSPSGKASDPAQTPGADATVASNEELTSIHDDLARLRKTALRAEIRSTAYDAAENWAVAAEFFDDQTGQHCFRVGHLAGMLAREVGLDQETSERIEHAARLHDIGKVAVNEMILLKPGPLNAVELAAMREHTRVGAELLKGSRDLTLQIAAEIAQHHHEWWNGAGYPAGTKGMQIPLSARICAYADVYDALTSERPYKRAWTHEAAVNEITAQAGRHFDPNLLQPFLRVLKRYVSEAHWTSSDGYRDIDTNGVLQARRNLMEAVEAARSAS